MGNYSGLFNECKGFWVVRNGAFADAINGIYCTNINTPTSANDRFGLPHALHYGDNTRSYNATKYTNLTGDLTILYVIRYESTLGNNIPIINYGSTRNAYEDFMVFFLSSTTKLFIDRWSSTTAAVRRWDFGATSYTLDVWNTVIIAVPASSGTGKISKNGVITSGITPTTDAGTLTSTGFSISNIDSWPINGSISMVILWSRILSDVEMGIVYNLINLKPIQNPHNLRSWWA